MNSSYLSDGTVKLLTRIRTIWESARSEAARSVNSSHVCANWLTGRQIVEAEQQGKRRAGYGKSLLKDVSFHLTHEYGEGFSVSALQYMRAFFLSYPHLLEKQHALRVISPREESSIKHENKDAIGGQWRPGYLHPGLSWTHYRTLLKIDRERERAFYEIEAINSGWSARQLERQINSMLFFRLQKSKDKKGLLSLANKGQEILTPVDAIKDPYVLEFLKLPESPRLVESKLESALITMLKDFLLELGNGFAFVGRQRRITLEGDHFYPDLVFYHARLKCYVIVDLLCGAPHNSSSVASPVMWRCPFLPSTNSTFFSFCAT